MKPVFMTKVHNPPASYGNCYAACIASILELSIDEVPPLQDLGGFNDGGKSSKEWWEVYRWWLQGKGLEAGRFHIEQGRVPLGYSILTGRSPRHPSVGHCVVALDGKQVHDPASQFIGARGSVIVPLAEFWDFEVIHPIGERERQCYSSEILDLYGEWRPGKPDSETHSPITGEAYTMNADIPPEVVAYVNHQKEMQNQIRELTAVDVLMQSDRTARFETEHHCIGEEWW